MIAVLTICSMDTAEARVLEPQRAWWSSGSTCVASRNPPGRRWRALPPRSCARSAEDGRVRVAVRSPEPMHFKRKAPADAA
jgi:hypothetical protein